MCFSRCANVFEAWAAAIASPNAAPCRLEGGSQAVWRMAKWCFRHCLRRSGRISECYWWLTHVFLLSAQWYCMVRLKVENELIRMSLDVFGMPSGCLRDCLVNCFVWIWKGASISPVFSWHFECDIMTIVVLNCIVVCRWSNFLFVGDLPIVCWQMYCRRVACLSNLQFVFVRMQHSVVYLAKWMIFMAFFIRFTCFCILSICKKWFWKWLVGSMESKKYSFVLFFFDKIAKMYLKNHTFASD